MAFKHGKDTEVWIGAFDVSTFCDAADLSTAVETGDTTTFKSDWKTALPGLATAKMDVKGKFDPTAAPYFTDLIQTASVLTYGPAGMAAIGDVARLIGVNETAYAESAPVGGIVAFSSSFLSDAAVGFGSVLHVGGEDTNTTTGATKNDGAATSTGWVAHLHVTAVDAGSWVIKLEDAAVSNFSYCADVTSGTFTAATGATSQRLVSAAGATLKRYVRYVATRTGGSAGDGITFALAYSRNS